MYVGSFLELFRLLRAALDAILEHRRHSWRRLGRGSSATSRPDPKQFSVRGWGLCAVPSFNR
eukprot:8615348-Pyramimonas_sp.AAC.1